jgi:hypothetical protein
MSVNLVSLFGLMVGGAPIAPTAAENPSPALARLDRVFLDNQRSRYSRG